MKRTLIVSGLCLVLAGAGGFGASRALLNAAPRETTLKELPSYRDVVKRVLPAVVSIEAKRKAPLAQLKQPNGAMPPFGNMPGLPDELKKELERFHMQPPPAMPSRAFGSGFIVDPAGVILTNEHVVQGADEVEVHLQDGRKFIGRDIKKDPKTDLAVVRIETKESLPFLKLGDSDATEIGDRVLAIGAPLGLKGTVTTGIVSAKGRDIHVNMYEDFLQTDAAINPGNSGGPLVNLAGQVIGINSVIKSRTGGFQGVGLAIASNLAKNIMQSLLKDGVVHRGYLGISIDDLSPDVAARFELKSDGGVVVGRVFDDSPASRAGLQAGDIVTALGGKSVKTRRELQTVGARLPLHRPIDVTLLRD